MLWYNCKRKIALFGIIILVLGQLCGCAVTVERPTDSDAPAERHIENLGDIGFNGAADDGGLHNNESANTNNELSPQSQDDNTNNDSLNNGSDDSYGEETSENSGESTGDENTSDIADVDLEGEENDKSGGGNDVAAYQDLRRYTDDEIAASAATNVGRFAYERLSQEDRRIYNEMYLALNELSQGVYLDCLDPDKLNRIFVCVMTDHPEIFWTTGYVCSRYTRGDVLEAIGFKGSYSKDMSTIEQNKAQIDSYVNNCLAGLPTGDDYSKIKYIYEYIILHTEYDLSAPDNQNICSVFINGRSVCQGYAKATQYLLGKAGVMCTLVSGVVGNNESHSWNLVAADGSYYYVDTTWGDASYISTGSSAFVPSVSYDYLCVTTTDLLKTHTPQPVVDLPLCGSYNDNYYVREGAYFTSVDTGQMASLFERYQSSGREYVTLKCSDANVYNGIKDYLINSQNIFDYIHTDGTVSYWESGDEYSISFKL